MIKMLPWEEIKKAAIEHGLDQFHIAACIMTETLGNRFAARFEPKWRYFFEDRKSLADDLMISVETETMLQATSFGYMQVMGAVARENGLRDHITVLIEPDIGIKYGCIKLKKLLNKYGNIYDAIAAYNAGSVRKTAGGFYENQKHVDRFDLNLREIIKTGVL